MRNRIENTEAITARLIQRAGCRERGRRRIVQVGCGLSGLVDVGDRFRRPGSLARCRLVVSASMPPAKIARPESVPVVNSSPVAIRLTFIPPAAPGVADEPVVSVHEGNRRIVNLGRAIWS